MMTYEATVAGGLKIKVRAFGNPDALLTPESVTVECESERATFPWGERKKVGEWIRSVWERQIFQKPVDVYYNIGWDNDHIHISRYEYAGGAIEYKEV